MPEKRWGLLPGLSLETACWDNQLVLFHNRAGDTHLLDGAVDWVLAIIGAAPRTLSELIGLAIDEGIVSAENDNQAVFSALLENLEKIDLVESWSGTLGCTRG